MTHLHEIRNENQKRPQTASPGQAIHHNPINQAQNQHAQQKGNAKRRDDNTGTASLLKENCAYNWDSNTTSSHNAHPTPTPPGIYTRTNKDLNLHGKNFQTNDPTYQRARKQQK
jgi:hypothetical protein